MPPLQILKLNSPSIASPRVIQDDSASDLFVSISKGLDDLAMQQIKTDKIEAIGKAAELGAKEGSSGAGGKVDAQKRPGYSLTSQAYNNAAKESASVRLELEYTNALEDIKNLNLANPAGYEDSANSYINGFLGALNKNPLTQDLATLFEKKLKFKKISDSQGIKNTYNKLVTDRYEADLLLSTDNIKTNAYRYSKGVFSEDPNETLVALQNYKLSLQALTNDLNKVLPNGLPAFQADYKTKALKDFSKTFFTYAFHDIIDQYSNNYLQEIPGSKQLTIDMIDDLQKGIAINIPGTDITIDVMKEMGADNYDNIIKYAENKLASQERARQRQDGLFSIAEKKIQRDNAFSIISSIKSKKPLPDGTIPDIDYIQQHLNAGTMSESQANAAMNVYFNETVTPSKDLATKLRAQIIMDDEDMRDTILRESDALGDRFEQLYNEAQQQVTTKIKTEEQKNIRTIYNLVVQKTGFDTIEPTSLILADDFAQQYTQYTKGYLVYDKDEEGNFDYTLEPRVIKYEPKVALEIVRQKILAVKSIAYNKPSRIPIFYAIDEKGNLDLKQSALILEKAITEKTISGPDADAERLKLEFMENETERRTKIRTEQRKRYDTNADF